MSNNIEKKVMELLEPIINDLGYEIYDVIYEKEAKDYYLRIFIDKDGTIDINDCEVVTNSINDVLDERDIIKNQYYLEVSSPGIERNLRTKKHFLDQIGNKISLKLFTPINKEKEIVGILKEYNDEYLEIILDDKILKVDSKNIAKAKTIFEF